MRALPRVWLFTDERMGEALWAALARLPKGGGVVFRHYSLPEPARRALFKRVRRGARARRQVLFYAASGRVSPPAGAHGVHGAGVAHRRRAVTTLRSMPVHNPREAAAAIRARVDLVFISPVFATRSHPGGRTLGRRGFAALAQRMPMPAIALGGMTQRRLRGLRYAAGWAAIDAWSDKPSN